MSTTAKAALAIALAVLLSAGPRGVTAAELGVRAGKLAPCPRTPNCVSSQETDAGHGIAPFGYQGTAAEARRRLMQIVAGMPRARLVVERDDYLRYEFTSLIFRFVDDVEFWMDDVNKTIHLRSASRVGRSDWGVNRQRIETIRAAFR